MNDRIGVMISSKVNAAFGAGSPATLEQVRRDLRDDLNGEKLLDEAFFNVWTNETSPSTPADEANATETCLRQVDENDLVVVLFTGAAGWAASGGDIGICHAEFRRALDTKPAALRIIRLPDAPRAASAGERARDEAFKKEVLALNKFAAKADSPAATVLAVRAAVRNAVTDLLGRGLETGSSSQYHVGPPLSWARMNFDQRSSAMIAELKRTGTGAKSNAGLPGTMVRKVIGGETVALVCHAIPAAMTVATARERVGQPFLLDHRWLSKMSDGDVGPVHAVACYQGVTESQAIKQLGFPDATILSTPFGVYVSDGVQRVQMVFLSNCRDRVTTREQSRRLFEWLDSNGESVRLAKRAKRRREIVLQMAKVDGTES